MDILTFGQYLQPTPKHLEVTEFVTPEKFEHWRKYGEETVGFRYGFLPCIRDRDVRCELTAMSCYRDLKGGIWGACAC